MGAKFFAAQHGSLWGKMLAECQAPGDVERARHLLIEARVAAERHGYADAARRAAATLRMFTDLNGCLWDPDASDVDEADEAVPSVAANRVDEAWFAVWLRDRVRLP